MRKISQGQSEAFIFYAVMGITLLPVVFCQYIVTGDGPCHLYNSKILLSWLVEGESQFFKPFYQMNPHLVPNWITNVIQIPLLKLFSVIWAEKIFFILYLLAFGFGFRKVIREINPNSIFLAAIGPLFAWNDLLIHGFTNNSWSMAIWFWTMGFWMQAWRTHSTSWYSIVAFLFILLYLSHPMGFVFSVISIGCLIFSFGLFDLNKQLRMASLLKFYVKEGAKFLLIILVPLGLLLYFLLRTPITSQETASSFKDTANSLLHLIALKTVTSKEQPFLTGLVVLILILLGIVLYQRLKDRKGNKMDGFLLMFLCSLWFAFSPLGSKSGGISFAIRLSLFPYLCLVFWLATGTYSSTIRHFVSGVTLLLAGCLMYVRLPVHIKASHYAEEVVSCLDSIKENSTLLTLNYDWTGQTPEGEFISDRALLFGHVDCYLGAYKNLVISDNYEANFWYFPVVEMWQTNMYFQTDKDGINFDHRPPRADIVSYKRRTGGHQLDYVLLLAYRNEFESHPYTHEIFQQLDAEYVRVFTSEFSRAILFRRTNL